MWSLPNITAMNARAKAEQKALLRAADTLQLHDRRLACDACDCPADVALAWYDVFSPDPKGLIAACRVHHETGEVVEGYFLCDSCDRWFIENYTWETYYRDTATGRVCLGCALRDYLNDDKHWIPLNDQNVTTIGFDQIRRAPHVLAVEMPVPRHIKLIGSVLFDSMTGGAVRSLSTCDTTPDRGIAEVQDLLREATNKEYKRATLILDGAYQFAVSIGVYVPARKQRQLAA